MEQQQVTSERKSTYSGSNGGGCVGVGETANAMISVRDTVDLRFGQLVITRESWSAFINGVRNS